MEIIYYQKVYFLIAINGRDELCSSVICIGFASRTNAVRPYFSKHIYELFVKFDDFIAFFIQ